MKFVPVCCFCGKSIRRQGLDPLSVAIFAESKEDSEQTFWAHMKCFRMCLVDPDLLSEALGGPKLDCKPVSHEELARLKKIIGS